MNATTLALLPFLSAPQGHAVTPAPTADSTGDTELTTGGLRWSQYGLHYLSHVTLGDRGGQVLVRPLSTSGEALLFSSFDSSPPVPIWTALALGLFGGDPRTDAAASEADVFLIADINTRDVLSLGSLKKFTSRSGEFVWKFDFPRQAFSGPRCDVSRDGQTIVSAFWNEATLTNEIRVHDPATGAARRTILFPPPPHLGLIDLSPDGRALVLAAGSGVPTSRVVDLASQSVVLTTPGFTPARQALSDEGLVLVVLEWSNVTENHLRVLARGAVGYQTVLDVATPLGLRALDAAVSDDGSTVVAAWGRYGAPYETIVRAYDVATGTMTMERIQTASAEIFPSDVAISSDGSRFVVGLAQPGSASHAELAVYRRDSSQPLAEHPSGGAVLEVDMSPDGKRYAAKRVLTNDGGWTASYVELYELGREDFVVRGRPEVGATVNFELHGAPGAHAVLLRSFALARNPIDVPGVGTLHLDPTAFTAAPMGIVPPSGPATLAITVEQLPGMVGRTLFYQGLTTGPRSLTRDWVQLTVVP